MSDERYQNKFNKTQLKNFEQIERRVLTEPSIIENLKYILTDIYQFGNYVVERITDGGKKCIRLKEKSDSNGLNVLSMLEGIEEYWDELTIDEKLYVDRIRRLYEYQLGLLKLTTSFPNVSVLNRRRAALPEYREKPGDRSNEQESKLKNFQRGELQKELEPLAKEYELQVRESVSMKKVRVITRRLINKGWDAKETSVAEALRKMGFVRGTRK